MTAVVEENGGERKVEKTKNNNNNKRMGIGRVRVDPAFFAITRFPLKKVRLVFLFKKNHF